ncbi:MAG: hypothetical protein KDB61_01015, partial [Planctomycetes bacterium]|nr:hypothetical protein [Planctomycetota bacterium]
MMRAVRMALIGFMAWLVAVPCLPAIPMQSEEPSLVEAHVASVTEEWVFLDRGWEAGLAEGDWVTIYPEGEPPVQGTVRSVTRSFARVEVLDPVGDLQPGNLCQVFVAPPSGDPEPAQAAGLEPEAERPNPEHPPWSRAADDWPEGGALLAEANPISARERPLDWDARLSLAGTFTDSNLYGRRQSASGWTGFSWKARNPFARGGELDLGLRAFARAADGTDGVDWQDADLALDRLSYRVGGRRDEPTSLELGRFLPRNAPEFGRLDGALVERRLENGRMVGLSVGHLPGLADSVDFDDDWQVALSLNSGLSETRGLSWRTAFQHTWHGGENDRDLWVLGSTWSPKLGQRVSATAWVDWYTADDLPKSSGPELTRLHVFSSRALGSGAGLHLAYSRNRRPHVLRQSFDAPLEDPVESEVYERVSLGHWTRLDATHRLNSRLDYWRDGQEDGLHGELEHD